MACDRARGITGGFGRRQLQKLVRQLELDDDAFIVITGFRSLPKTEDLLLVILQEPDQYLLYSGFSCSRPAEKARRFAM
jgi:hypothetical protein